MKPYAKILIVGFILIIGSCVAVIVGGSKRVALVNLRSTNTNIKVASLCKKIRQNYFDCTDEATKEKAKEIKTWYVQLETKKVTITAYNNVPAQTDSSPCISSDGSNVCELLARGHRPCAYNQVPFGTLMEQGQTSLCVVHDRLPTKYSDRLDIDFGGVDQIKAAKEFGIKRNQEITIIYPPNEPKIIY